MTKRIAISFSAVLLLLGIPFLGIASSQEDSAAHYTDDPSKYQSQQITQSTTPVEQTPTPTQTERQELEARYHELQKDKVVSVTPAETRVFFNYEMRDFKKEMMSWMNEQGFTDTLLADTLKHELNYELRDTRKAIQEKIKEDGWTTEQVRVQFDEEKQRIERELRERAEQIATTVVLTNKQFQALPETEKTRLKTEYQEFQKQIRQYKVQDRRELFSTFRPFKKELVQQAHMEGWTKEQLNERLLSERERIKEEILKQNETERKAREAKAQELYRTINGVYPN